MQLMGTSMENLWDSLDDAAEVVSCPKINGLYRSAVWDDLCSELPGWLISLLVSCMTLSALLLLLVSCFFLTLSLSCNGEECQSEPTPLQELFNYVVATSPCD